MIYSSTQLIPNNVQIPASINNTFTWQHTGDTQTHYQLKIYKNSDNSLVYDSTKLTSANEYHSVPSGTLTVNNLYKWRVQTWVGLETAISSWSVFTCATNATLTIGSLPSSTQSYLFESTYYSAQSIPLLTYRAYLFLSTDLVNPIADSGDLYPTTLTTNGIVSYTFDGMESGNTYAVQFTGVNQKGYAVDTGTHNFTITYSYPPSLPELIVTNNNLDGTLMLDWVKLDQIFANVVGDYSYTVDGKFSKGIQLDSGTYMYYTKVIPQDFTCTLWVKMSTGFAGDLIKFGTDDSGLRIFYDGSRFGFQFGDYITVGRLSGSIYGDYILIGVKKNKVFIKTPSYEELLNS